MPEKALSGKKVLPAARQATFSVASCWIINIIIDRHCHVHVDVQQLDMEEEPAASVEPASSAQHSGLPAAAAAAAAAARSVDG